MPPAGPDNFGDIPTVWSLLDRARRPPAAAPSGPDDPRAEVVAVYDAAVVRYLRGCVHDPDAARELAQEFWLDFFRGAFDRADPARGSFRQYLKTALSHLATRARSRRPPPAPLPTDVPDAPADDRADFDADYRRAVLDAAWRRLRTDPAVGAGQYAALRVKADHPDLPADDLARLMPDRGTAPMTPEAFRKALQRGRERFAECLYAVVAGSLRLPGPEDVATELADLGLLRYCRSVADRQRTPSEVS